MFEVIQRIILFKEGIYMVTELIKSEMSSLTKNLLKEDYLKFKEEKKQLKIASLKENVVFTESLTPFSEEFSSTLKSLTLFENRIEKMKMIYPELHKESNKLWTSLDEVNTKRDVKLIKENISDIINLYCHVQEELTMTEEHPFKGTWENLQIREEISKANVSNNSKLLFGIPKIKRAMVSLNEGKMLLSERLETKDLMKVQDAIERLKGLMTKYPLQAINIKIENFDNNFKKLLKNERWLEDKRAGALITQVQTLYGALTKFFSQDMEMIVKMKEFKEAKENPNEIINKAGAENPNDPNSVNPNAEEIKKIIYGRLSPDNIKKITSWFARLISGIFGQNENSSIDVVLDDDERKSIADEILLMTFNQLTELINASKGLPKPRTIVVSAENATATEAEAEALKGNDLKTNLINFVKSANPEFLTSFANQVKAGKDPEEILKNLANMPTS